MNYRICLHPVHLYENCRTKHHSVLVQCANHPFLFLYMQPAQSLFITPNNLRRYASYIDDSVTIGSRIISVATGSRLERLFEIPIMDAGEFNRYTTIQITVGLDPNIGNDHDPHFSITDGSNVNEFITRDGNTYPCHVVSGSQDAIASTTTRTSGVFTFTFTPFYRYGICSVTKDGGYTTVATFNHQLDLDKDISFTVRRDHGGEQYSFYYILIETFE